MEYLLSGVVLWCVFHFVPTLGKSLKTQLVERIGNQPYRGIIALGIFAGVGMMYFGWTTTEPIGIYEPPTWAVHANNTMMLFSLYLFVCSELKTWITTKLRHPMLMGFLVWGIAHLLANGDQRSLVVFGGLSTWALVEMVLINVRDGALEPTQPPGKTKEMQAVLGTALTFGVITSAHAWLGPSPFPG